MSAQTTDFAGFAKSLRGLGPKLERATKNALFEGAQMLVGQVQAEIATTTPHPPVDMGVYRAKWQAKRTARGATVGNATPQALWIEIGRRPGPVSEEGFLHLVEWVRRKKLYLDAMPKGASRKSKDAVQAACESVATAIRIKLSRVGYEPRYPLRRAIRIARPQITALIIERLRQVQA